MIQDEFVGLELPVTLAFCMALLASAVIARVLTRLFPADAEDQTEPEQLPGSHVRAHDAPLTIKKPALNTQ